MVLINVNWCVGVLGGFSELSYFDISIEVRYATAGS